jgi:hypothetical protein
MLTGAVMTHGLERGRHGLFFGRHVVPPVQDIAELIKEDVNFNERDATEFFKFS